MNTLKMKSFKSVIFYVLLLWAMAIAFGIAAVPGLMNSTKEPIAWDTVDFSGDIEGLYVTGTIYGIYDYYCEETEDGTVISREYLTDADGSHYIALRAEGEDMTAAAGITFLIGVVFLILTFTGVFQKPVKNTFRTVPIRNLLLKK